MSSALLINIVHGLSLSLSTMTVDAQTELMQKTQQVTVKLLAGSICGPHDVDQSQIKSDMFVSDENYNRQSKLGGNWKKIHKTL